MAAQAAAGVVAGAVLIVTLFALASLCLFFPPLAGALRLPLSRLIRATNGREARGAGAAAPPLRLAAFSLLDPAHPVARSCEPTGRRPSRAVLAWRVAGVALAAASLAVNGATPPGFRAGGPPAWFLVFFTNWTFILFLGTGLLGTFVSAQAVWRDRKKGEGPPGAWTVPAMAHVLATACVTPTTLFITIFYWGALFPAVRPVRRASADAVMKHGANTAWALGDALLSRTPACTAHFAVLTLYVFAYVVFMWGYASATGEWMYGVLDWRNGPATLGVYAALPALLALCAVAWYGLAAGREAALVRGGGGGCGRRRRGGGGGKAGADGAAVAGADGAAVAGSSAV